MFYEYGEKKDGKVVIKLKEKSFSKDLFEIYYNGKMVGSLKKKENNFTLPDGKILSLSRKFMADKYDLKLGDKEMVRFSSWRLSDEEGKKVGYFDNTGITKTSHKIVLVFTFVIILGSLIYGLSLYPNRDYPYPQNTIKNVFLITLLFVYIFRNKIYSQLVTFAKYLLGVLVILDLGYIHYLAFTGTFVLSQVLWGDFFFFVLPGVLIWITKSTILKNPKN